MFKKIGVKKNQSNRNDRRLEKEIRKYNASLAMNKCQFEREILLSRLVY